MTRPHLRRVRVIPTLLLDRDGQLVKTVRFRKRTYIGDPINAVQIFSRKEVDELVLFDIDASRDRREPNYKLIERIASEAFMPVCYGGGIRTMSNIEKLYRCGVEKVSVSSCLTECPNLINEAARRYGSQAVVVCMQVKKSLFGNYRVRTHSGVRYGHAAPEAMAREVTDRGAGEIIIYAVDRDGMYSGYDVDLLRRVSSAVDIPVVACGGARNLADMRAAVVEGGCSAVAAGSLFVYQARDRGVLITYPSEVDLACDVYGMARPSPR